MIDVAAQIPEVGYGFGAGVIIDDTVIGTRRPDGSVLCEGCKIWGSMDMKFDIKPTFPGLLKGGITITSHGLGAYMKINASLYSTMQDAIDESFVVFAGEVPCLGLYLVFGKIRLLELGLGVELVLHAALGQNPEPVLVSTGYNITLPDKSTMKIDLLHPNKVDASGWKLHIEALEPAFSDGISVTGRLGQEMRLVLALEDIRGGGEAGFIFGGGEVVVHAKGIDKKPACGNKKANRGVDVQLDVAEKIGAYVSGRAYLWGIGKTFHIASTATPAYSKCMPITYAAVVPQPTHLPTPILEKFMSQTGGPLGSAAAGVRTATSKVKSIESLVQSEAAQRAAQAKAALTSHVENFVTSTAGSLLATAEAKVTSAGKQVSSDGKKAEQAVATGVDNAAHAIKNGFKHAFGIH